MRSLRAPYFSSQDPNKATGTEFCLDNGIDIDYNIIIVRNKGGTQMESVLQQIEDILKSRNWFKKEAGQGCNNWYDQSGDYKLSVWPKPETWMFKGQGSSRGLENLLVVLREQDGTPAEPVQEVQVTEVTKEPLAFEVINTIKINTQVEFIHRYKLAPEPVSFLREWHRHMLHISVEASVTHEERELEFILIKRAVNEILATKIDLHYVEKSCETVGRELGEELARVIGSRYMRIEVFEDGENGSITIMQPVDTEEIPWD